MSTKFDGWPHVIRSQQFDREWLEKSFLPVADEMEQVFYNRGSQLLQGRRMVSLFYQPSTRTRMSHEAAMSYLGGTTVFSCDNAGEFSSASKGETFEDTIRVINCYRPDVIVIRYSGSLEDKFLALAGLSGAPIINAGDRSPGQHPTQALLDLRTIKKHRGSIDGLKIAMVGDLRNGRTVRSLSYLLSKFKGVQITFVAPAPLQMLPDVKEHLREHSVGFCEENDILEVAEEMDVIYMTRAQTECGADFEPANRKFGNFVMNKAVANSMKSDAIIMHPLPRRDEITPDVDADPRAVYLTKQVESGLVTRMAMLKIVLAPNA